MLEGIKVLSFTHYLQGPSAAQALADLGADVVKIEACKGAYERGWSGCNTYKNGVSVFYLMANRNQRDLAIDLKSEEGRETIYTLIRDKGYDVIIENFRPGVMDKLGVDYDVLKDVNDQIIYGAVSGFGCYGPYSQRPGYDIIAQSSGGLMSITGEAGGHPLRVGNAMGDVLGGMNLTIGILTALHARALTGKGQRVDVSLVDSVVSSLETGTQRYFASGKQPELMGNRYASAYPYDSFQASDGLFVIGCGNDKLYTLLCTKVLMREDLLTDPRFDTNVHRCENHEALKPEIEKWTTQHTIDECVELILDAGVPASPINDLKRVTTDPHIAGAREMFVPMHHPIIGDMKVNGNPVKLLDTKADISRPAPDLGQDNAAVYGELLGLTEADLTALKEQQVI